MEVSKLKDFYRGKTVLVTGHTGFKGSWLTHTLLELGADVVGVSLAPITPDDIFVKTRLESKVTHHEFDIRDSDRLTKLVQEVSPDIVFHLAAQPLVRLSYDEPLTTVTTNVAGTANVLEAVRLTPAIKSAVIITTDKVYENKEWNYGYRENDPLGGHDPYSGSKAAADIVTQAYLRSFFSPERYRDTHNTLIAIARAGNVIGGGDWSPDRLVPDIVRGALRGNGTVTLRYPDAVRPWEHVMEPVSGYLLLGMRLAGGEPAISGTWNFGPGHESWVSVGDVTNSLIKHFGTGQVNTLSSDKHEANMLTLDTTKARRELGWTPRWGIDETLAATAKWYIDVERDPSTAEALTKQQIRSYFGLGDQV